MAHSANTFWERAAACEALKRHTSDESALEELDRLMEEEIANALELEAFGVRQHSVFADGPVCTRPDAAVVAIVLVVDPLMS